MKVKKIPTVVVRIPKELHSFAEELMKKNNIQLNEAFKEITNMTIKLRGRNFTKEIKF